MNENVTNNPSQQKSAFTVRSVLRVLSILGTIFVFCPSFLVSCSGQDKSISILTAIGGVSSYGETVVPPHLIMLLCFVIPIATFILLFNKKMMDKALGTVILVGTGVNFVLWILFCVKTSQYAKDLNCDFKIQFWYILSILSLLVTIALSLMVFLGRMYMETDLKVFFTNGEAKVALQDLSTAVGKMSTAVTQMAGEMANQAGLVGKNNAPGVETIGFCNGCGSPIPRGCDFCSNCGTKVPPTLLAEYEAKLAEEKRKEEERIAAMQAQQPGTKFCPNCGQQLKADAMFCAACGTKQE